MNILHWPTSYPDTDHNQPYHAIFVQEHIKATANLVNNRVLFISPETIKGKWKIYSRKDAIEDGIPITRLYFNRNLHSGFLNIYIRCIIFLFFLELILFKRFYPNIIHVHFFQSGEWAALFAKLFQIKMIVTEHWTALIGYPVISEKRLKSAKKVYENACYVLPVSTHLGKGILENTHAEISHKMQVIHNCVDTILFKPEQSSNTSKYNLISVARLEEQKDMMLMYPNV